jgi:predicted PolB exonuclease-like 3'-5' exonuclease
MALAVVDIETVALDDVGVYLDDDDPIHAPSNWKDPEKIAEHIAAKTRERAARCALDPDLCRLVAVGWMFDEEDQPSVITCTDEYIERLALSQFWRAIDSDDRPLVRLVTFGGITFDLPVLMRRSDYLGVDYRPLSLDKYRSPHPDVLKILTFNGSMGIRHNLRFYARRFDVPVARPDLDGSDIAALVAAGAWDDVEAHCADDIRVTHGIARKLGLFSRQVAHRA